MDKDCQEVDVLFEGKEPRLVRMGSQLSSEEVVLYRNLILEFRNIFVWSYKDIKGMSPEITMHTIPLISNAQLVYQKEH